MPYGGPTQNDCETLLVVCTADDNVIIDGIGTCLAGLECDPIFLDYENAVLACFGLASGLTEPCVEAGTPSNGDGG